MKDKFVSNLNSTHVFIIIGVGQEEAITRYSIFIRFRNDSLFLSLLRNKRILKSVQNPTVD